MEAQESPGLVAAWKAEKRWFRRTVGFAAALSFCVLGWFGASYWAYLKFQELHTALSAVSPAEVASLTDDFISSASPIETLGNVVQVLLPVSGLGFLVSLAKWLLAIRRATRDPRRNVRFARRRFPTIATAVNDEISAGLTFALKEERHWYLRGIAWGCAAVFAVAVSATLWAWYDHRLSLLNAAGAGGSPEAREMVPGVSWRCWVEGFSQSPAGWAS